MSFYRTLLAAVAAVAIASPVFADDAAATTDQNANTPAATQTTDASSANTTDQSAAKVNVNTASAKDLVKVKGITASKARAIVAYRKKHGNFKSVSDITKVKGFSKIKSDTLNQIEGQLTVE